MTRDMFDFNAMAPNAWKLDVIKCLLFQLTRIFSDISLFNCDVAALKEMFIRNSYPSYLFDSIHSNFMRSFNVSTAALNSLLDISTDEDHIPTVFLRVPYLGKCSSIFARCLSTMISNTYNVKVNVMYCTFKIRLYFSLKCFSPFYLSSYIVYPFECKNESCTDSYVSYTIKHLQPNYDWSTSQYCLIKCVCGASAHLWFQSWLYSCSQGLKSI